jgi:hypothetical protein
MLDLIERLDGLLLWLVRVPELYSLRGGLGAELVVFLRKGDADQLRMPLAQTLSLMTYHVEPVAMVDGVFDGAEYACLPTWKRVLGARNVRTFDLRLEELERSKSRQGTGSGLLLIPSGTATLRQG